MMAPMLLATPPLSDCVLEFAAGPDVELLAAGSLPPRAFDGAGAGVLAGSEPVEVGELIELVDLAETDVLVDVDVNVVVVADSTKGSVKPFQWSWVISSAQAKFVTGSTAG